jgi:hypothetical protein
VVHGVRVFGLAGEEERAVEAGMGGILSLSGIGAVRISVIETGEVSKGVVNAKGGIIAQGAVTGKSSVGIGKEAIVAVIEAVHFCLFSANGNFGI